MPAERDAARMISCVAGMFMDNPDNIGESTVAGTTTISKGNISPIPFIKNRTPDL